MFRYGVMIARNIYKFPGLIGKMRKLTFLGNHSEEERYRYLQKVITMFQKTGYTKTEVYGEENLPEEGGREGNRRDGRFFGYSRACRC